MNCREILSLVGIKSIVRAAVSKDVFPPSVVKFESLPVPGASLDDCVVLLVAAVPLVLPVVNTTPVS